MLLLLRFSYTFTTIFIFGFPFVKNSQAENHQSFFRRCIYILNLCHNGWTGILRKCRKIYTRKGFIAVFSGLTEVQKLSDVEYLYRNSFRDQPRLLNFSSKWTQQFNLRKSSCFAHGKDISSDFHFLRFSFFCIK